MLINTIILIREGGTVFDFRRLQHWDMARVAASLVVEYSPITFNIYFGSVPSGLTIEIYFFVLYRRSGGGRLLVFFSVTPSRNVL